MSGPSRRKALSPSMTTQTQLDVLESQGKIPNRKYTCNVQSTPTEFPMYMAMATFCVTPTGFTDKSDDIFYKILMMCGELSSSYTIYTTHLLAAHAFTQKMEVGRKNNIPIITEEWVENLWNACKSQNNPYLHASQPQFRNVHCPLFYNLTFVVSNDVDLELKAYYKRLIEDNGGIVGDSLKKSIQYFYVCQHQETRSMFLYAQERSIKCITPGWIVESISRKNLPPLSDYEIKLSKTTTTIKRAKGGTGGERTGIEVADENIEANVTIKGSEANQTPANGEELEAPVSYEPVPLCKQIGSKCTTMADLRSFGLDDDVDLESTITTVAPA